MLKHNIRKLKKLQLKKLSIHACATEAINNH